jgi:DNA-binding transcriptional MerR regulator
MKVIRSEWIALRVYLGSFQVKRVTLRFMKVGFTPRQVMQLTGVPYSTLNLWAKNGLVSPSIGTGTGTGSERIYSFSDLVALKVAFEIRKAGVTTASLKKVVQFLQENHGLEKPLAEARLVVSGRDVLVVRGEQQLVSALARPGQSCLSFVVDLPRTLGELVEMTNTAKAFGMAVLAEEKTSRRVRKRPVSANRHQPRKRA